MQQSENIIPMIGNRIRRGPGGKNCACCAFPQKYRKAEKRSIKRGKKGWI